MGCDIHVYVEYRDKNIESRWATWRNFGGRYWVGRDYTLFARLRNVRSYGDVSAVVTAQPLPGDLDWTTKNDYYYHVVPDADFEQQNDGECKYVKQSTADEWVARGYSKRHPTEENLVSCPDWHSAGCVDLASWKKVIRGQNADARWHVIAAMCKELENRNYETRIVFWFDN